MRLGIWIIYLVSVLGLSSSTCNTQALKYWIFFKDKTSAHPQVPALSQQSLTNRLQQQIPIDYSDYPVSSEYLSALTNEGVQVHHRSRWLNAVSATLSEAQKQQVQSLAFVERLQVVARLQRTDVGMEQERDFTGFLPQLNMIALDSLHDLGYTGAGIRIAVFDNGFRNVQQLAGFEHLFDEGRIIATRDYVDGDSDVFEDCARSGHCNHGTSVLSVLAAKMPESLWGAAPDAEYILLRTEDDRSETPQEEDNWVAAAEFADSLGAQVFSTSLGYSSFDPGFEDYRREDFDGSTAIITLAADRAASKGIVVVNSAGNRARSGVSAPADGKRVIAVGSVNSSERRSSFSSVGPSADGRIKPDIMAMGQATTTLSAGGSLRNSNGTSFSCPLISGMLACLKQAAPLASSEVLYQAMIQSADRFNNPDLEYGYGIPNALQAFELLEPYTLPSSLSANLNVFPNPSSDLFNMLFEYEGENQIAGEIELLDLMGRVSYREKIGLVPGINYRSIRPSIATGMYLFRLKAEGGNKIFAEKKIIFSPE